MQPPLRAPLSVCLWVTDYCNLSCRYCYAEPQQKGHMEYKRLIALIDELVDIGVFDISVAGGEPLLYEHIFDVVEHCGKRNIQLGLLTNAVLLDDYYRAELTRVAAGKPFLLQVSLDSPNPEINNRTRGRGHEVIRNIHGLKGCNIETQISCVLTSANIDHAHTLIDTFYPVVKRFHFLNVQRTRLALENKELLLQEAEIKDFWNRLDAHAEKFPSDLFLPSLRITKRMNELAKQDIVKGDKLRFASFDCPGCSAGITHINIASDFDVLGCDIAKDYTIMGNVAERSFKEVWHSKQAAAVRDFPVPACYLIKDDNNLPLLGNVRPEYHEKLQQMGYFA